MTSTTYTDQQKACDDAKNQVTLDRRDLWDYVRGAIHSALNDKILKDCVASWAWQEATNRTMDLFQKIVDATPAPDAKDAQGEPAPGFIASANTISAVSAALAAVRRYANDRVADQMNRAVNMLLDELGKARAALAPLPRASDAPATDDTIYQTYTGQNGWLTVSKDEYERTKDKYEHRTINPDAPATAAHAGAATLQQIKELETAVCNGATGIALRLLNNMRNALAAPTPVADSGAMTDDELLDLASQLGGYVSEPRDIVTLTVPELRALLAAAKPVSVDAPTAVVDDGVTRRKVEEIAYKIAQQNGYQPDSGTFYLIAWELWQTARASMPERKAVTDFLAKLLEFSDADYVPNSLFDRARALLATASDTPKETGEAKS